MAFTPIVTVKVQHNSYYPCDSDSVIKQISHSKNGDSKVTCNGVIVSAGDDDYDVIFNKPGKWGNGNLGTKQTIKLTSYTEVFTFNNSKFIHSFIDQIFKYNM